MAVKVGGLSLVRIGGTGGGTFRAGWNAPAGEVAKRFRARSSEGEELHKKRASSATSEYRVVWSYTVLDTKGRSRTVSQPPSTTKQRNTTFSPPENAVSVKVSVSPIAAKYNHYTAKGKTTTKQLPWYSGSASAKSLSTGAAVPDVPTIESVEADGANVKVKVSSEDPYVVACSLWVYRDGVLVAKKHSVTVAGRKEATFSLGGLGLGHEYGFAARIQNERGRWSREPTGPWAGAAVLLKPPRPASPPVPRASGALVYIDYPQSPLAGSYEGQYVTAASRDEALARFAQGDGTTVGGGPSAAATGVIDGEPGKSYFFRCRYVNRSGGTDQQGDWSDATAKAFYYGTAPAAPTVWNSADTCTTSDTAWARWVHNSTDGSEQSAFEVWVDGAVHAGGAATEFALPVSAAGDGDTISWMVRTQGALAGAAGWSPWSEVKRVRVWEQPALSIAVDATVSAMPIEVVIDPASPTQSPIACDASITAKDGHWVAGADGEERWVEAGAEVWAYHTIAPSDPERVAVGPGDISLADGEVYTVSAAVVMSSGLTCENEADFLFDIDLSASLYVAADLTAQGDYAVSIAPYAVDTAPEVPEYIASMRLSIFRRDTDGSFIPLATNIPNDGTYSFVDAHAPFGAQSYRIVAIDQDSGYIAFGDAEGGLIDRRSICISWRDDEAVGEGEEPDPETVLELPCGIELSESYDFDMDGLAYIGGRYPVSAYGTQAGARLGASAEFRWTDKSSIALVRRLAVLGRDAYVREPLGSGYYARVKPSLGVDKDSKVAKVQFDIVRSATRDECEVY